jgi:DNA-3-methyladenine glycosylase
MTREKSPGAVGFEGAKQLDRSFTDADPIEVAPRLLGKLLSRGHLLARIVEVEAYRGADDAASHAYRGKTARNATMFGPSGCLYVYFTYGMHYCANVVCWPEGKAGAVLLRALAPVRGLEEMAARRFGSGKLARPARPEDLCSGPAKLCQAFGIDRTADGFDLVGGLGGIFLLDDGTPPPEEPANGTRIGLGASCTARDEPWRWWVPGEANVSRGHQAR